MKVGGGEDEEAVDFDGGVAEVDDNDGGGGGDRGSGKNV